MPPELQRSEIEKLVRTAIQNRYTESHSDEAIEAVDVDYDNQDGTDHLLRAEVRSLELKSGIEYQQEVSGHNIVYVVEEILGMGNGAIYRLRVRVD